MMTGKDGGSQIVEASLTGHAQVTLTFRLCLVSALLGDFSTVTGWAPDTLRPAEGTDSRKAFSVVNERLKVYHGASIAPRAEPGK